MMQPTPKTKGYEAVLAATDNPGESAIHRRRSPMLGSFHPKLKD